MSTTSWKALSIHTRCESHVVFSELNILMKDQIKSIIVSINHVYVSQLALFDFRLYQISRSGCRDDVNILIKFCNSSTYGHSQLKTGHPVRSAIHKQLTGRLVLRWVTTWESLLLYVLVFFPISFLSLSNVNFLCHMLVRLFGM
jgi:hypothetical protein